jgi:hypothetical protein
MKKFTILNLIVVLMVTCFACSESINDKQDQEAGDASLKFYLTDNPGEYQEVNIEIEAVMLIINDTLMEIPSNPGIYNLLDFTNGKDTLIADVEYGEGYLSQIRLILGDNNSVMIDSVLHDLKTPSAQTSGLKLNVHQDIVPGEAYSYVIDFDAQKSIVERGNGKYNLKPVIRVFTEVLTGSVHGIISPVDADSLISLVVSQDSSITTVSDTLGNFMFRGLEPGEYSIDITATSAYSDTTLTGIEIQAGLVTELDTIFIK